MFSVSDIVSVNAACLAPFPLHYTPTLCLDVMKAAAVKIPTINWSKSTSHKSHK